MRKVLCQLFGLVILFKRTKTKQQMLIQYNINTKDVLHGRNGMSHGASTAYATCGQFLELHRRERNVCFNQQSARAAMSQKLDS